MWTVREVPLMRPTPTEVWNALRTTYLPSVLYKVKLVAFRDEAAASAPDIGDTSLEANP